MRTLPRLVLLLAIALVALASGTAAAEVGKESLWQRAKSIGSELGAFTKNVAVHGGRKLKKAAVEGGSNLWNKVTGREREFSFHPVPESAAETIPTSVRGLTVDGGETRREMKLLNSNYGHGGWMGMAPTMLSDSRWVEIVKVLMPDVYREVYGEEHEIGKYMTCMENNPLMSAYGFWWYAQHEDAAVRAQAFKSFEWDLFIAPELKIGDNIDDKILIAHGVGSKHLRKESKGVNTFHDVAKLPKTDMGGVTVGKWCELFTRALWMIEGNADGATKEWSWTQFQNTFSDMLPARNLPGDFHTRRLSPFPVALDIKTGAKSTTHDLLMHIQNQLNDRAVLVKAWASFDYAQIEGFERFSSQDVHMETFPSAELILFSHGLRAQSVAGFHLLGKKEILDRCEAGDLKQNQKVMFNGGFLITYPIFTPNKLPATGEFKQRHYSLDRHLLRKLISCKERFNLDVGIYTQEYDIDIWALRLLFDLVEEYEAVFTMGFAWGGFPDRWYRNKKPGTIDATVGTAAQAVLAQRALRSVTTHIDDKFVSPAKDLLRNEQMKRDIDDLLDKFTHTFNFHRGVRDAAGVSTSSERMKAFSLFSRKLGLDLMSVMDRRKAVAKFDAEWRIKEEESERDERRAGPIVPKPAPAPLLAANQDFHEINSM